MVESINFKLSLVKSLVPFDRRESGCRGLILDKLICAI